MSEINKVTAGDSIRQALTARNWNELVDGNLRSKEGENALLSEFARHFRQSGIVLVKNTTPNDLPRNHILGIDLAPLIDPDESLLDWKNDPAFIGVVPLINEHLSRFVVLLDPIPKNGLGRAWVSGAAKARVVIDDTDHRCCDVDDEQTNTLRSSTQGGATILTKQHPDSTGEMWCDIRLADCSGGRQAGTVQNKGTGATLVMNCPGDVGWMPFPFDDILGSTSGNRFFLNPNGTVTITGGGPLTLAYKIIGGRLGAAGLSSDDAFWARITFKRGTDAFTEIGATRVTGIIDDVDAPCDPGPAPFPERATFDGTASLPMCVINAKAGDIFRVEVQRYAGSQQLVFLSLDTPDIDYCSFFTLAFNG